MNKKQSARFKRIERWFEQTSQNIDAGRPYGGYQPKDELDVSSPPPGDDEQISDMFDRAAKQLVSDKPHLVYLSIPYSFNPDLSFNIANKVAAKLMCEGRIVYSPISHCHSIEKEMTYDLDKDSSTSFWLRQDFAILDRCSELIVILIGPNGYELVRSSEGCRAEIKRAREFDIPVTYKVFNP